MKITRMVVVPTIAAVVVSMAPVAQAAPIDPARPPAPRRTLDGDPARQVPRTSTDTVDPSRYELVRERVSKTARPPRATTPTGPTRADVDGDGLDEIVIGSSGTLFVDYSRLGVTDVVYPTDWSISNGFASQVVVGDFNGDGYADVATGNPGDTVIRPLSVNRKWSGPTVRIYSAGSVWIIPGGPDGLRLDQARYLNQDTPGVPSSAGLNKNFGWSLAAGDLNGDGRDDLAVAPLQETVSGQAEAGAVTVLFGSSSGISTVGALWLHQDVSGVPGVARQYHRFGLGLAIGNVTGDKYADLAVGVPYEGEGQWAGGHAGTGRVILFRGAASGVSLSGVTSVTAWDAGVPDGADWPDPIVQYLGFRLAIGDVTGDGYGELVANAPASQVGQVLAGAVVVLRGSAGGLTLTGRQVISESSPGVPGAAEHEQWFAGEIAVGDVTGDGRPDLLIGSPDEDGSVQNSGSVVLLPGTASGFTGSGAKLFTQSNLNILGGSAEYERFGASLGLLNLDGQGALDVLIGSPGEINGGFVTSALGGSGTLTPHQSWSAFYYVQGYYNTANFPELVN